VADDYDVIYRALADFSQLTTAAAKAREDLKSMQEAAREESAEETRGAAESAAAHDRDTAAIKRQRDALVELAATSKAANKETTFGGRDSMQAHLSDLDAERQKEDLLNRTRWGGMSNPQSWEAWQQQVWQHQIIRNKEARQGYATPDQYLSYLDQERSRIQAQTDAMKSRSGAIASEAQALQAHNDALRGAHESAGTLGTTGTQNIQGWTSALAGVPTDLTTRVRFDDAEAMREGERYRASLAGAPGQIITTARLDLGTYLSDIARLKRMAALAGQPEGPLPSLSSYTLSGPATAAGPGMLTPEAMRRIQAGIEGYQAPRNQFTPLEQYELRKAVSTYQPAGTYLPGYTPSAPPGFPAEVPYEPVSGPQDVFTGHPDLSGRFPADVTQRPGASSFPPLARVRPPSPFWQGSARPMTPEGAPILSTEPYSPFGPSVGIRGKQTALEDVASIKSALKDLSQQIANPKVEVDAGRTVDQLATVNFAMRRLQQDYKGTGLQPSGYSDLQRQFKDVQSQAERAFDSISAKGSSSANSVGARWSALKGAVGDAFRSMEAGADDAAQHAGGAFATLGDRLQGALRGLAGGGGVGNVFKSLALAAAAAGSSIVGSIAPMIATFTVVIQLLPALVAGFGALATVFAAMPETIAAIATAMATLKEAIDPVVAALQAYSAVLEASESAAANPLQTAMQMAQMQNQLANAYYEVGQAAYEAMETQLQDAHAVSDAQYSLSQAVVQSANAQVVAAHAVYDAQFQVSQANFEQSIQQVESAMSVADAQHSLADAVFATQQAQYQLDIAWQTASEDLANLMIQVDYASVNLRGAQLALEQAQQNYATTMANSNATALDRAQAAYQIQQAEEALAEQEQQNKDTETQLADVRKYGASQVFGVTQAQHALTDAEFQQQQAAKELVVTEREAANAQIEAAHEVIDAVFELQQAYFNQKETAITGAHQVSDAQFELSQAQMQQGEGFVTSAHDQSQAAFELQQAIDQMALGLPSIASAEEQLATDMYKLGPAAKTAVLDLEPLAKWFVTNKSIGQAFFSQMLPSLSHIGSILRPLQGYLVSMALVLGSAANSALTWFEKLTSSPAWKILTSGAISVIRSLADAVGHVADGFTKLAIVATPFTEWLMRGIDHLADRFDKWATNADKAGSNFRRWLRDVKPALDDIGGVVKAIVDGFSIMAGGPMGSSGSLTALHEFENLMKELSTTILPAFFSMIHALSSPQMVAAITQLFGAMTKLLLIIVNTPGFQLGFQLAIRGFTLLLDAISKVMEVKGVGDVLGVIAGGIIALGAAFTVLKYTGILALINNLKRVKSAAQTAYEWLKKVTGFGGGTGESGAGESTPSPTTGTAGQAFWDKIVDAAQTFKRIITGGAAEASDDLEAGGAKAGDSIEAGAATAKADEEVGGASGSGEGVAGGGLAAILGKLGLSSGIITPLGAGLIAGAIIRAIGDRLAPAGSTAGKYSSAIQSSGFGGPGATGPAGFIGWAAANKEFSAYSNDVYNWFTQTLPNADKIAGNAIATGWDWVNTQWVNLIQNPIDNFFNSTLPNFFTNSVPSAAASGWNAVWEFFSRDVFGPLANFFTTTVPGWFSLTGVHWGALWSTSWDYFTGHVIGPADNFFTKAIPGYFDDVKNWFEQKVGSPIGHWFSTTLPSGIEGAFKNSINWVISNVINKAIGFINDVTGVVGIPKIKPVQRLAAGGHVGSVPGTGDEDSEHAILTPGEYVISKPARMAIDAQMGPGFLYGLNSMKGYASGGSVGDNGSNPVSNMLGIAGNFLSGLGSAGGVIENLIGGGLRKVEGLFGKGAKAVFDGVWDHAIEPLVSKFLDGDSAVDRLGEAAMANIKKGIDKYLSTLGQTGPTTGISKPVTAFTGTILQVLKMLKQPAGDLNTVLAQMTTESGGNEDAVNRTDINWIEGHPSVGLMQVIGPTFDTYAGPYRDVGPFLYGVSTNPLANIYAGLNYATHRYGEGWTSVLGHGHGYYTGGDVISAVKQATANQKYREAMLLGAQLSSGMDPEFALGGKRFGAWSQLLDKDITERRAKDPYYMARHLLPAFERGVSHYGWGRVPQDAAMAAAMAEKVGSFYTKDGAGAVNLAWGDVLHDLGIKTQTSPGASGSGSQKPGGESGLTLWNQYVPKLKAAVLAERKAYDTLYGAGPGTHWAEKSVDGVKRGSADWSRWYAMDLILQDEKGKVLSDSASSDYSKIEAQLANPTAISTAWWADMLTGTNDLAQWEYGDKIPPRSAWAAERAGHWPGGFSKTHPAGRLPKGFVPGQIQPSIAMFQKHQRTPWEREHDALLDVSKITAETEAVWKELYGPGGSLVTHTVTGPPTPGPGTPPPAAYSAAPNYTAAILAYAGQGGPAIPQYAAGGSVGGLASMFSGFQAGGSVPDFSDFTPAFQQPGMQQAPRALSEAAQASGAGQSIGMQVNGGINVHNPLPERASDSIAHQVNRLSFLHGRGVA
jgi:SLT domain-containing protein